MNGLVLLYLGPISANSAHSVFYLKIIQINTSLNVISRRKKTMVGTTLRNKILLFVIVLPGCCDSLYLLHCLCLAPA